MKKKWFLFFSIFSIILCLGNCYTIQEVKERELKQLEREGVDNYRKGNYDLAIDIFNKIFKKNPYYKGSNDIRNHLISSYMNIGNYELAIKACNIFINDYQTSSYVNIHSIYKSRGLCYYIIGNIDLAINDFTTVINMPVLGSIDREAYLYRGKIFFEAGRDEEALSDLKKCIQSNEARLLIGELYLKQRDYYTAYQYFIQIPTNERATNGLMTARNFIFNNPLFVGTTTQLKQEIESNRPAAVAKYEGKAIRITGTITNIQTNRIDVDSYLRCYFYNLPQEELFALRVGQRITITGIFTVNELVLTGSIFNSR